MTNLHVDSGRFTRSVRIFLTVSGLIALIAGAVLLIWPAKSAVIVTGIFAAYLIVSGLVYLALGVFSSSGGGWARTGHVILGLLYVATGIIAFANLAAATVTFALIVVIFIGVSWIVDGVVAFSLISYSRSKIWTVLYALLGIIAGVIVLLSPLYAAAVLWLVLGISLAALGVVQVVRAITLKADAAAEPADVII